MILRRPGNKSQLAESIYKTFPKHQVYLEPFFGTGSMYFKKPKAKHNIVNDIDDDVFNLWHVYTHKHDELLEKITTIPKSESLFKHWKKNKESDPVLKALRFLMLSNFSYLAHNDMFRITSSNPLKVILKNYMQAKGLLGETTFCNSDFRDFFRKLEYKMFFEKNSFSVLCYNDPPYLGTSDNYSHSFKEQDSIDLFNINCELAALYPKKYWFAISEFNHPLILEQAKSRNLNIIQIRERRTLKNRQTEILICNYDTEKTLFG